MTHGITAAGTVHITMADGTTRGTGEAAGAGMTHGTIHSTAHTTADGTEDGILIGDIITITDMVRDTSEVLITRKMSGMVQGIRPVRTEYSAAAHHSEAASAQAVLSAETAVQPELLQAVRRTQETPHPEEYQQEEPVPPLPQPQFREHQ